jgi:WD40 repeat protein
LVFSRDGLTLFSASYDRTVRSWDVTSGKVIRTMGKHQDIIYEISLSPDGKVLASAGQDNMIRLWDVAADKEIHTGRGHEHAVLSLGFTPDHRQLISAGRDGTIRVWHTETGKELQTYAGHPVEERPSIFVNASAFSPDGRTLASVGNDQTLRLWDALRGKELVRFPLGRPPNGCLAVSSNGRILASEGEDQSKIYLREAQTGKILRLLGNSPEGASKLALSPDGTAMASVDSTGNNIVIEGLTHAIRLWDTLAGTELHRLGGHPDNVALAFSPDGRSLASAGGDNIIRLCEVLTGQERCRFENDGAVTATLAFSPDGKILATAGWDWVRAPFNAIDKAFRTTSTIRLWDVVTGKERGRLAGHSGVVMALAFSQDGQLLASGGSDTSVLLWDQSQFRSQERRANIDPGSADLEYRLYRDRRQRSCKDVCALCQF